MSYYNGDCLSVTETVTSNITVPLVIYVTFSMILFI